MKTIVGIFLVLVAIAIDVNAHDYELGECHPVSPMDNFDMDRMLGMWYAIQKVRTYYVECLTYNFTRSPEDENVYYVTQDSMNSVMQKTPLKHRFKHTGKLTVDNAKNPGEMKAKFGINLASRYVVFDTDYVTYAGIYTCQDLWFAKRYSATILSRTPTLDYRYVEKLRSKLSKANMNPYYLNTIDQEATGCKNKFNNGGADDIFETRGRQRVEATTTRQRNGLWDRVEILNNE